MSSNLAGCTRFGGVQEWLNCQVSKTLGCLGDARVRISPPPPGVIIVFMIIDKNLVLVSGAVVFKEGRSMKRWFLVRQSDDDKWEIPKVVVRKGESSVRAALRMMGEQGGMTTQVIEEAGRAGGVTTINEKTLPQRHLYYLMVQRQGTNEAIGFIDSKWLEYAEAIRKLSSKREKVMLRQARKGYQRWKKEQENIVP